MTALAPLFLFLTVVMAAFGDKEGEGNEDTLFTGFSLVVIIVIGFLIFRHFAKKG